MPYVKMEKFLFFIFLCCHVYFTICINMEEWAGSTYCSSGHSNSDLIKQLKENGIILSDKVESIMRQVDRGNYVSNGAYEDTPKGIGFGATISAPHMHVLALELLKDHLVSHERALDVGSGSGYLTASMALMMGPEGRVIGIDHMPELVNQSTRNIEMDNPDLLSSGRVKLLVGDGRRGYKPEAPYNAIHVGATAVILHEELVQQLKPGGRLIIPIKRPRSEFLEQIDKLKNGTIVRKQLLKVSYVPLTDKSQQWRYE